MSPSRSDLLLLIARIITAAIQIVMGFTAAAIAVASVFVLFFARMIDSELRAEYGPQIAPLPVPEVIGLLVLAMGLCALVFLFFGKLRGIIVTVRDGDPFVPENADRLNAMAWFQIGIYVVGTLLSGAAALVSQWATTFADVEVSGSISADLPSVLLVLVLFILARVFRHGAAMRADLEGTV